jgi:hypothetical protein
MWRASGFRFEDSVGAPVSPLCEAAPASCAMGEEWLELVGRRQRGVVSDRVVSERAARLVTLPPRN